MRLSHDIQTLVEHKSRPQLRAAVEQAMNSDPGSDYTWVFVEGAVDEVFYSECFFQEEMVKIVVAGSTDSRSIIHGGKKNVLDFVSYFVGGNKNTNVIGIVDRDYSHFSLDVQALPINVFETDARDIEMTLWNTPSAYDVLLHDYYFPIAWRITGPIVSYMGALRVANEWAGTNWKFPKTWKTSTIWTNGALNPNWRDELRKKISPNPTPIEVNQRLLEAEDQWHLSTMPLYIYGRGHDVLGFTSTVINRQASHSERGLVIKMMQGLSLTEMKNWQLYINIKQWQIQNGKNILIA